ncbi:MAG: tRNA 2-thiouridine(34) synthase MnmA [Acidobacteriota bacterium]
MKTAVLVSGGVDSSVALRLLLDRGHDVTAFYLKIWLEDERANLGDCPWDEDLRYVRAVCDPLGVPVEVVPLQREYHQRVVEDAIRELRAGRTPSPDILCNRRVKFGAFFEFLETNAMPFDAVATGHYARVEDLGEHRTLLKAVDPKKDQTYFLHRLTQDQLARSRFPLGSLHKAEVRALAKSFGLATYERPDSQGICFLGTLPYDDFVRAYLGEAPGEIRHLESGRLLGTHRGCWFFTIGQRRGLGLGGGPWFVVAKNIEDNLVWVTHRESLDAHGRTHFDLVHCHWIGSPPVWGDALEVKLRHGPRTQSATLTRLDESVRVDLTEPDPGIAAGQSAVVYDGERCLGGGLITLPTACLSTSRKSELIEHDVDHHAGHRYIEPNG